MAVIIASLFLPYQPQFHNQHDRIQQQQQPRSPSAIKTTITTRRESKEDILAQLAARRTSVSANSPTEDVGPVAFNTIKNEGMVTANAFMKTLTSNNSRPSTTESSVAPSLKNPFASSFSAAAAAAAESDSSDEDFEMDAKYKNYNVPSFGGVPLPFSGNEKDSKAKEAFIKTRKRRQSSILQDYYMTSQWQIVPSPKVNGGLKNAIETAKEENTIMSNIKWVGTMGLLTDHIPSNMSNDITKVLQNEYNCYAISIKDKVFQSAYHDFCKTILWPTLHYQLPDNLSGDLKNNKTLQDDSWRFYNQLNQLVADKIVECYNDSQNDIVWIHDYHLMLVPAMVRSKLPNAKIGFSLHVSFPSSEVFRCLAQRDKILQGILYGANYVGFQTKEYARHFTQTANRLLMADVEENFLKINGKIISLKTSPIGIDYFKIQDILQEEETQNWQLLIKEKWYGKNLIVSRDTMDKMRGIDKKLLAFEQFLKENPEYIETTVFLQICLNSIKDPQLDEKLMVIVNRINSLSSNISIIQPVVFLHQQLDFAQYLAINSQADVFFVNALREGMNLTCHEFIACSNKKNSPLLLSEFTGSAELFRNSGAHIVNPWDVNQLSVAIKNALTIPKKDKKKLWKQMVKEVIIHDSDSWVKNSIAGINNSWEFHQEISQKSYLSTDQFYADYFNSHKRMFIFKITEPPAINILSILNDLCNNGNIVYVISTFSSSTMETIFNRIVNIGLIAENGAYVRLNGSWYSIAEQLDWKQEVIKILEDKVERLPGSYCKAGDSLVEFHTEHAEDQDRVKSVVGEAVAHINTLFDDKNVHAFLYSGVVYVQESNLASAALNFLLKIYNSTAMEFQMKDDSKNAVSGGSGLSSRVMTPAANAIKESETLDYFSLSVTNNTNDKKGSHKQSERVLIDFVCVAGASSPTVEPLFHFLKDQSDQRHNDPNNEDTIKFCHSIAYDTTNSTSTYAKERIDGFSKLFTILGKLNSMKSGPTLSK